MSIFPLNPSGASRLLFPILGREHERYERITSESEGKREQTVAGWETNVTQHLPNVSVVKQGIAVEKNGELIKNADEDAKLE